MKVKDLYMAGRKVSVRSGDIARLWVDPIGDQKPFMDQFPRLSSICNFPECTVKACIGVDPMSFFRRRLSAELKDQWQLMVETPKKSYVFKETDDIKWSLGPKTVFTTR